MGSSIAEVHNGSSLFTGDAGQGESNIRRWSSASVPYRDRTPGAGSSPITCASR